MSARALSGVMKTFSTWPQFASPLLSHSLTSSRPTTVRVSHLENVPAIVLQNGALCAGIALNAAVERKKKQKHKYSENAVLLERFAV